jgi:(R,R)-butanediol dehydrogenase/meso-butanediol dehydrogenase/diacetyl reductase
MLAVRWHARGDVRVEEVSAPVPPGPGEVQLQVRWCGICGTDLEEWLWGPVFIPAAVPHPVTGARAPLVLGHEFAGVVADLPRAFRTADLWLIHAADCCSRYSSWTCCGVRY